MSHTRTKCLAVLAAWMACDTAAGGVPGEYAGTLESCRRAVGKPVTERSPRCGQESDAARGPDARGRRSDTYHFFAYQGVSIAILYALPESVTGWTDEKKDNYSLSQWWEHVQDPGWDSDDFFLNYVTHPYWGAAYFVRSRERGYGEYASFWYSAALSASYEFGAEALFENPSIQDLVVTPVGGWLLGRYFMAVREDILGGGADIGDLPFRQRAVLALTDPLGAINRTVDGWFGLDQPFAIRPFVATREVPRAPRERIAGPAQTERVYGLSFTYAW